MCIINISARVVKDDLTHRASHHADKSLACQTKRKRERTHIRRHKTRVSVRVALKWVRTLFEFVGFLFPSPRLARPSWWANSRTSRACVYAHCVYRIYLHSYTREHQSDTLDAGGWAEKCTLVRSSNGNTFAVHFLQIIQIIISKMVEPREELQILLKGTIKCIFFRLKIIYITKIKMYIIILKYSFNRHIQK